MEVSVRYTISQYYTPVPATIGSDIPLEKALEKMKEGGYRHLPVKEAGRLVGVVSDRDLKFAAALDESCKLKVEDIMTDDPYTCQTDSELATVAMDLANHKYGCAIVLSPIKKVVGIFTVTNALYALADMVNSKRNTKRSAPL